ncbi:MAG: hypothetical protein KBT87_02205 [Gammaproteobacteria bacterium]|nr:hypothetical protein [Gammaproteobacteria bacterium]MBQ0773464.1 hypothetical protein [Gammaproteobacteria bacterium]
MSFTAFLIDYFEPIPVGAWLATLCGVLWFLPRLLGAPASEHAQAQLINKWKDSAYLEKSEKLRRSLNGLNRVKASGKGLLIIGAAVMLYGASKSI